MQTALSKSIIQNLGEVKQVNKVSQTDNLETLQALFPNLRPEKKVKSKSEIRRSKGYKKDEAYVLVEVEKDNTTGKKRIRDIRPFKTIETLLKIIENPSIFDPNDVAYLFTPNPVKIPRPYWKAYKHTRDPEERKKLATRYKLLKDDQILNISCIVIDIDSPFEQVYPVWQELLKKLEINKGYAAYRTKSGRFHGYLRLTGKYNNGSKTFKLTTSGIGRNGKTHIQNAYEIQHILAAFFEKRGLKYDDTFIGRLNHLIWLEGIEVFRDGKSELYEFKEGEIPFYTLYRQVKKLQKEEGLWECKGKNITDLFWGDEEENQTKQTTQQTTQQAGTKQRKIKTKAIKLRKTDIEKLEEAIEVLKEKHKTLRFTKIMLPVCGWAKYLNIDKNTVYHLLRNHLITKKNFEEDFEKAWKYGDPLEFSYGGEDLLSRIEKFLNEFVNTSEKFRLDLLELFSSEADYYDTERYLSKRGYIEEEYRKTGGRGRPRKVIKITQKALNLIQQWKAGGNLEELLLNDNDTDNTPDTDNNLENDFTLNNFLELPEGKQYPDITSDDIDNLPPYNGLGDGWINKIYQGNPSIYNPDNPLNPSTHLTLEPLNKTTNPLNPSILKTTQPVKKPPILRTTLLNLPISKTNLPINPPTKINPPVKLTTSFLNLPTFDKKHKQSFVSFIFTDTFTFHLPNNPTHSDLPTLPYLSLIFTTFNNFEKLKKLSTLSETNSDFDKTIIDGTTYEKTTSENLSTFDNLSETYYEPLDPDKDKQVKPKKPKDKKDSKAKKSNKEKQKEKPKKNLNGGFGREARIMALLMGYEREQMGRAIKFISECISYFYQKTHNIEEAIYRTFALYLFISEKFGGKKVFIPPEIIQNFEEGLHQTEKLAWGYFLRFKEKYNLQRQRERQKQQKQKQKQKKLI